MSTVDDIPNKQSLLALPGVLGAGPRVERALLSDSHQISGYVYVNTFEIADVIQGIYTGLRFCETDGRDEWVYTHPALLQIVRCDPTYSALPEPIVFNELIYLGRLRSNICVYTGKHGSRLRQAVAVSVVGVIQSDTVRLATLCVANTQPIGE